MAFRRVVMQPAIRISSPSAQEVRYSTSCVGWHRAMVWVNVFENATMANTGVFIHGASAHSVDNNTNASPGYWPSLGSVTVTSGATGAFRATFTPLPDYVLWAIRTLSANIAFQVVLYLWDT